MTRFDTSSAVEGVSRSAKYVTVQRLADDCRWGDKMGRKWFCKSYSIISLAKAAWFIA
jgi:hypothetical protein